MSAAAESLARLRGLGVRLWVEQSRLRYRAPKGVLNDALLGELRQHKAELVRLLTEDPFASIPRIPEQDSYELSHAQWRLWVLSQLGASVVYNVPLHQWLEGDLDHRALEEALIRVVNRHESLRTSFVSREGEPRQTIQREGGFHMGFVDLSADPDPEHSARALGRRDALQPFDLAKGPLLRASLLRLGEHRHVLLWTVHHIVCDGVSIAVLERDLAELYRALRRGEPDPLLPLRIQYRDYARWQNLLLAGESVRGDRDYWLAKLGAEPPVLDLPLDFPRPAVQSFNGRELSFVLDLPRTRSLVALGRRHQATLFMLLVALLKTLLYRYTGQRNILLGSPCAGRGHPDLEGQIGFYLNMLALRDEVARELPFSAFLEQVRRTVTEALDHQIYPFDRLVDDLGLARDLGRSPLFDVILILQNQADEGFVLDGLAVRPFFKHPGTSKIDLSFCFKETSAGLVLSIEYNTALFRDERIACMGAHFSTLLDSVLANPTQAIGRLNLLPGPERRRLLYEFNATAADYPRHQSLPALLREQVARTPEATAVVAGGRGLSYRRLEELANGLAWRLQGLGVGPNRVVGLYAGRSVELVVGLLGILKSGGAYLPLDPAYPAERLAYLLEDSGADILLTESTLLARLPSHRARVVLLSEESGDPEPPEVRAGPGDLAYVIYTSGSTGRPKGVSITQASLVNVLWDMARRLELGEQDTLLAVTTLAFDIAALEIYLPLLAGARIVLADRETAGEGARLQALLTEATLMQATPATWRMLVEQGWSGSPDLTILCGGEALSGDLAEQLLSRGGSVWNLYGPTETTIWSALQRLEAGARREAVEPIGRPIANTRIYVLDPYLEPVPIGAPGELCIGGVGLSVGYLGRPSLSAEKFVPDPFGSEGGARLYHTGDRARFRSDGSLEFLGRIDDQMKIRGFRLEPGEVEAALAAHPAVRQAVVVARDDPPDGQRLVAYLTHRAQVSGAELQRMLKNTLPDYMVPSDFVFLETFPLTPNGKLDRRALPSPERGECAYAPPRDALEQVLAAAWQRVLGLPQVSIHDDFFALGGHSLKAARLLYQLRQALGVELSLADVFRQPSIAALAHVVRSRRPAAAVPSLIAPLSEPLPGGIQPPTAEELELLSDA